MQVAGLSLEDVRREEEAATQDWEQAVPAVRAANDASIKPTKVSSGVESSSGRYSPAAADFGSALIE
jgi:hypothetical protein